MKMTPSKLLNIILLTIISTSFFLVNTTANTSNYETTSVEYNPWRDLNDDGIINIYDVVMVTGIYGSTGTPINKTELLLELQSDVASIEEKLSQVKWIRFYKPNETMNNQQTYKDAAVFVWTPNNSINNAILSIRCYFQYRAEPANSLQWRIDVNGDTHSGVGWLYGTDYTWSPIYPDYYLETLESAFDVKIYPNQNNYTLKFQFASENIGKESYVKDINLLLQVADGLPANP